MKFCTKCGKQNEDNAKFCLNCGNKFESVNNEFDEMNIESNEVQFNGSSYYSSQQTPVYLNNKKSSLDKVSMIIGIIAICFSTVLCCCFPISYILSPIAIILGIIYVKKYPQEKNGKAIAGIVLGAVALMFTIIITILLPDFIEMMKEYAYQVCQSNPDSDECESYKSNFPQWFM